MHAVDESVQTSQIIGLENIYSDILNNFYIDVKKDRNDMLGRLNHVAIAVTDLKSATNTYRYIRS